MTVRPERLRAAYDTIERVLTGETTPESRPDVFDDDVLFFAVDVVAREKGEWLKAKVLDSTYDSECRKLVFSVVLPPLRVELLEEFERSVS
jgi:hypothetical protein